MEPGDFYNESSRTLQRRFGTFELAAHLRRNYVLDRLEPEHTRWIESADAVYVASVDPDGMPECSYKGGLPGFVHVIDPNTLEIPSYDGNGMYRTLGNASATARIGLLFLMPEVPAKLRLNGECRVLTDATATARHFGAEAVLRVRIGRVFENCPRYLHDAARGTHSQDCPQPGHTPRPPEWKQKPEYEALLPPRP